MSAQTTHVVVRIGTSWWMNEWMNVHFYSDAIIVNCCRGTVQMLWVGSLEKCCFQLLTEAGRWRRRPDTSWQGVPGTCGRHWKCPVAECGSASWRHDECRRARRSESTLSIYFSGQLKRLGTPNIECTALLLLLWFTYVQYLAGCCLWDVISANVARLCLQIRLWWRWWWWWWWWL